MKIPFRCPVCNGTGRVPNGFYDAIGVDHWTTSDATPEPCRSCGGTGIVYVEQDETFEMKVEMREEETNDFKFD
jgi:DnaJ-class molecular chaperone